MLIEKDFSYEFYRNTLLELKKNHRFVGFESVSNNDLILRYDVDIALQHDIIGADSLKFKENRKYLSDSVQNWREGSFSNFIAYENLYILIHPIWWSDDNKSRVAILQSLEGGDLDYYKKEIEYLKNLQNYYLSKIKNKN